MSGEAIYLALTRGVMKTQADGLSSAQIFALLGYIAPTGGAGAAAPDLTPTCGTQPAFSVSANTPEWNGWSTKVTNSRFQDAASAGLTAGDLGRLKLKWAFNLGDATEARSQPAVLGRYVFIGATTGALYALDADSGCTLWGFRAASGIRGGVAIGDAAGTAAVFFSDSGANVYALNAKTGKSIWKVRPPRPAITTACCTRHSLLLKKRSAPIPSTSAAPFVATWWPSMPLTAISYGKLLLFPIPPCPRA
jgi:polyvinyl alcohol dehydrogenase (cytochrome)